MDVKIRPFRKLNDLGVLIDLEEQNVIDNWSKADFKRVLGFLDAKIFVATINTKLIGYILFFANEECEITRLLVASEYRRKGIGAKLFEKFTESITISRCEFARAVVPERELSAQLFLRKHGFRWRDTYSDFYDNGDSAYSMTFDLKERISA